MSLVSFVCLLALTSSAFGHFNGAFRNRVLSERLPLSGYGGTSQSQTGVVLDQTVNYPQTRPLLPMPPITTQTGYGQPTGVDMPLNIQQDTQFQQVAPVQQTISSGYGTLSNVPQLPIQIKKIQSDQGYGTPYTPNIPRVPQFDLPRSFGLPSQQLEQQTQTIMPTQADIMCQGQRPETVIPLDGGRRFVVCIDIGKGVEQACPKGLYYHVESRRCERKLGPLENPCALQPCLNGGQCIPTDVSSYQCQCPSGFDGKTCELDARLCLTQQPCGQTPDSRCQSFRLGAALQHVCICTQETAYGPTCQQAIPSPCTGIDGPQPLSYTNKGFIMCDGERMFVESCPGGTIWDDMNKACVWPDMQGVVAGPTLTDQSLLNKVTYGQRPQLEQSMISSYTQQKIPTFVQRPQFDQVLTSSYGGSVQVPQPIFNKPTYSQPMLPKMPMPMPIKQQDFLPPQQSSGY